MGNPIQGSPKRFGLLISNQVIQALAAGGAAVRCDIVPYVLWLRVITVQCLGNLNGVEPNFNIILFFFNYESIFCRIYMVSWTV